MEAMDADAVRAVVPSPPISGGAAADRTADALGTPNVISEKANVTAFVVRRFVDRGACWSTSARTWAGRCTTPARDGPADHATFRVVTRGCGHGAG